MPPTTNAVNRRIRIIACLKRQLAERIGRPRDSITKFDSLGPEYKDVLGDASEELNGKRLKNYGPMNPDSSFDSAVEFMMTVVQN